MDLPTISIRDFARLAGVDPSAVSRAARGGKRLTAKSVVRDAEGNPRIIVVTGCYEWLQYKDDRRDGRINRKLSVFPVLASQNVSGYVSGKYCGD